MTGQIVLFIPRILMPQAVLKSAELLNQLADLVESPDVIDEFTLRRLTREAETLIAIDPVNAYIALGRIAELKLDVEEVHSNFERAMRMSKQDSLVWEDYAKSLSLLGYYLEAANLVKAQLNKNISNLELLDVAIEICVTAGLFTVAHNLVEIFNKKSQEYTSTNTLNNIIAFMQKLQITEDMLAPLFKVHFDILRKHDVILRKTINSPQIVNIECDKHLQEFRYEIYIPKSVEEVCEMADELAEAVAEIDLHPDVAYHFYPLYRVKET